MTKTVQSMLGTFLAVGLFWAAPLATIVPAAPASAQAQTAAAREPKVGDVVKLKMRDGSERVGTITALSTTSVTIKVKTAVGDVEMPFERSEVAAIEPSDQAGAAPKADAPKTDAPAPTGESKPAQARSGGLPTFTDADNRVYFIELDGEFGRDVNPVPLRQILEDAKKYQPDILLIKLATEFKMWGQEKMDFEPDAGNAFNQLEHAHAMSLLFTDDIRDDKEWKTRTGGKPRVIMWVKKAMGAAAFLPYVVPDIYYTSDALHGGIGYLERIFDGRGDKLAQEKQYSLRLGRAEGLALKGGHNAQLVRAMSRADFVLSYSMVNGKPVFFEDESGEFLLTNNPNEEGKLDTIEMLARNQGKNVLTLDAETAFKVGLSKGTFDTTEDLLNELGVARSYVMVPGRADDVCKKWSRDVDEAERRFLQRGRDYQRVQISGATPQERNRQRSQQIAILREMKQMLERYQGALNPRKIRGMPAQWEQQIDRIIADIQEQIRRDR
jgi:hypothetical protein